MNYEKPPEADDLPKSLVGLKTQDSVDRIIDYKCPYGEYSVLLSEGGRVQAVRNYYLNNLYDKWWWVTTTNDGAGFIILSRRGEC